MSDGVVWCQEITSTWTKRSRKPELLASLAAVPFWFPITAEQSCATVGAGIGVLERIGWSESNDFVAPSTHSWVFFFLKEAPFRDSISFQLDGDGINVSFRHTVAYSGLPRREERELQSVLLRDGEWYRFLTDGRVADAALGVWVYLRRVVNIAKLRSCDVAIVQEPPISRVFDYSARVFE